MQSDDTLRQYFRFAKTKRRRTWFFIVFFPVLSTAYMLWSAPTWNAHVVLLIPQSNTSMPLLSTSASPVTVLSSMVVSHAVLSRVAEEKKSNVLDLEEVVAATVNLDANTVDVTVTNKNKKRAIELVTSVYENTVEVSKSLDFDVATRQSSNLESVLRQREKDLAAAEKRLEEFVLNAQTAPKASLTADPLLKPQLLDVQKQIQDTQKQLDIARQSAATSANATSTNGELQVAIPDADKWRNVIVQLEHELRVLETKYGPDATDVVAKRNELEEAKKTRTEEARRYLTSVNKQLAPAVADMAAKLELLKFRESYLLRLANLEPKEALEMQRLTREVSIQSTNVTSLRTQYEAARLSSQVPNIRFAKLSGPYIEEPAVNKRPVKSIGIGLIVGILVSVITTLVGFMKLNEPTEPKGPKGPTAV